MPQLGGIRTVMYKKGWIARSAICMDSQLTLVDARSPPSPEENVILTFDRDDMKNTTLRVHGADLPCYFVDTLNNITTICTGECLLATVTRRRFRSDQIGFPSMKPMSLGSWLKTPILSRW